MSYKRDFPIFSHHPDLVYLDSAASTQKPQIVIDAEIEFLSKHYANIHRGLYKLSEKSTSLYDEAREKIQKFINAKYFEEIIFTRNATEGLNLLATTLAKDYLTDDDEIIISNLEHHANIVSWQLIKKFKKIKIKVIPIDENGNLDFEAFKNLFSNKTKIVSMTYVSNVLGNIIDVKKYIAFAKQKNIITIIDGCQAVNSFPIDVQDLDCDFFVFSSHKLYGPTGLGVLYGKKQVLETLLPYQGGGDMIASVSFENTTFNVLPYKFEAGTPAFVQAYGLGKAIDYLSNIGMKNVFNHNQKLMNHAKDRIKEIDSIRVFGNVDKKVGIISFILEDKKSKTNFVHPHDVASLLDEKNIAIRVGHHCAEPLLKCLKVPGTCRMSFGLYNEISDIDKFIDELKKIKEFFVK